MESPLSTLETVLGLVARLVATSPAGEGLRLVGGFRYRLLDGSCRSSLDLDYHSDGDLEEKRDALVALFRKKLLPEVKRQLGYDASAERATGPGDDSPSVKTVELAAFRTHAAGSRIEVPVDVTRVACLDPPAVRTVRGTVYLTASDADMAESKVVALLQRAFAQDRDLLDLFLFREALPADAPARLKKKLAKLSISRRQVTAQLRALRDDADLRARGIDRIIREQVDRPAASHLEASGGGRMVFGAVISLLEDLLDKGRR